MMKAPPGLFAAFRHKKDGRKAESVELFGGLYLDLEVGECISASRPVVAWDDDGGALIVTDRGKLDRATSFSNFVGVVDKRAEHIVQLIAADGWLVWQIDSAGNSFSWPIAAWGLTADGTTVPVLVDGDGISDIVECSSHKLFGSQLCHRSEGDPTDWLADQRAKLAAHQAQQQNTEPGADNKLDS